MAEKSEIQYYLDIIREASDGESVRDAIINCMNKINSDVAVEVYTRTITKEFTQNGTFHEQYPAISGKAYKGVNLDITINVDGGGGGGGEDPGEEVSYIHVDAPINNDTVNGSYTAEDFGGDIIDNVVVEMDVIKPEDIKDNITIDISQLRENMFSALWEGYTAMQSITILNAGTNSGGGGGTTILPNGQTGYNYTFYSKPSGIATESDIPTGWSGVYQAGTCPPLPSNYETIIKQNTPAGESFTGWTPAYKEGTAYYQTLKFYPVFTANHYGGDSIQDTWATIIQNQAKPYNLGDTKTLVLEGELTNVDDPNIPSGDSYIYTLMIPMILVSKGEAGTSSTWISKYIDYDTTPLVPAFVPQDTFDYLEYPSRFTTYGANGFKWLNSVFINKLVKKVESGALYNGIVSVSKNYVEGIKKQTGSPITVTGYVTAQHTSRIWIPSDKELYIEADSISADTPEDKQGHIDLDGFSVNYSANLNYTTINERSEFFKHNDKTFGTGPSNGNTMLRDCSYQNFDGGSTTDTTIRSGSISSETGTTSSGIHKFGALMANNRYRIFGFCLG